MTPPVSDGSANLTGITKVAHRTSVSGRKSEIFATKTKTPPRRLSHDVLYAPRHPLPALTALGRDNV